MFFFEFYGKKGEFRKNGLKGENSEKGVFRKNELDQLLLVRNVGLDSDGCLCKASRILAATLRFPHHVGAGGEESAL